MLWLLIQEFDKSAAISKSKIMISLLQNKANMLELASKRYSSSKYNDKVVHSDIKDMDKNIAKHVGFVKKIYLNTTVDLDQACWY